MFLIGFLIGGLLLTRIISLIVEVPAGLILFFASRKHVRLVPFIGAALTMLFTIVVYAVAPVKNESLSSGNPALEIFIYAVCAGIWLGTDCLLLFAARALFGAKTLPTAAGGMMPPNAMYPPPPPQQHQYNQPPQQQPSSAPYGASGTTPNKGGIKLGQKRTY